MQKLHELEVRPHPKITDLFVCEDGTLSTSRRVLKPSPLPNGYMRVNIKRSGKQVTLLVHRAVAETFLSNMENRPAVNHIDGNKAHNHRSNLAWVTHSENAQHAWDTGLTKPYTRTEEHRAQFAAMVRLQPRGRRGHCIASQQTV